MPTITATYTDVTYTPDGVTAHYNQVCNVFVPTTPMPAGGYPCFILANNSGFTSTSYQTDLDEGDGYLYLLLKAGWVIISAKTTITGQTVTDGGAAISGKGYFKRHDSSMWSTSAFIEKDGPLLVQFARHNAKTYRINPNKVFIGGRSSGSAAALHAALAPDFSQMGAAWGFYSDVSSRPNGVVARSFPMSWILACVIPSTLSGQYCAHFADDATMDANTYTSQATEIGAGATELDSDTARQASALRYGFDRALGWYNDTLETQQKSIDIANKKQKFYFYSPGDETTIESVNFDDGATEWAFSTDPAINPYTFGGGSYISSATPGLTQIHSPWHMFALREALREIGVEWGVGGKRSRCVTTPNIKNYVEASTPTSYTGVERTFDLGPNDANDPLELDIVQWLQEQVAYVPQVTQGISVQDCYNRISHWLHTDDHGAISKRDIINDAQVLLTSMHRWRWLNRSTVGLDLIEDQTWVDIPDDVGEILSIESSDNSSFRAINLTTLDEVNNIRGSIAGLGQYWCSVVYSEPGPSGEASRPRLEIAPTPGTTEVNAYSMFYRARLLPVSDDFQMIPLPWFMTALWWEVLRSVAQGTYEEMHGTVTDRITKVIVGPIMDLAVQQDGRIQTTAGKLRGGILDSDTVFGFTNATTLAAPA